MHGAGGEIPAFFMACRFRGDWRTAAVLLPSLMRPSLHLLLSNKTPPEAGALILYEPRSVGVRNTAILQSRLVDSASNVLLVVLLAAIGQGHLWFLRNPGPRSLAW